MTMFLRIQKVWQLLKIMLHLYTFSWSIRCKKVLGITFLLSRLCFWYFITESVFICVFTRKKIFFLLLLSFFRRGKHFILNTFQKVLVVTREILTAILPVVLHTFTIQYNVIIIFCACFFSSFLYSINQHDC